MGEVRRMFRDGGAVKVSRSVKELYLKVSYEKSKLEQALNREPTVKEVAEKLGVSSEEVAEAVTNCIVHAYKEKIGDIYITAELLDDNSIRIKIRDKGCGIENIDKAMEPLYTTVGGERAGLGFAVMQSFMDYIKVSSKVGKGTTVTLIKKISLRFGANA